MKENDLPESNQWQESKNGNMDDNTQRNGVLFMYLKRAESAPILGQQEHNHGYSQVISHGFLVHTATHLQ
jgi:hypothetical protein